MKTGRYKNFNWEKAWRSRTTQTKRMLEMPFVPKPLWELDARLILEAYYKGPWRAIWALTRHELDEVWMWYGWRKWEWIRTKVFRRPRARDIVEFERFCEEEEALDEVAREL